MLSLLYLSSCRYQFLTILFLVYKLNEKLTLEKLLRLRWRRLLNVSLRTTIFQKLEMNYNYRQMQAKKVIQAGVLEAIYLLLKGSPAP